MKTADVVPLGAPKAALTKKAVASSGESGRMKTRIFSTIEDPMREVTGAGLVSHPAETKAIEEKLLKAGAEVEYRSEAMGYMPSLTSGKAGKFIIDPEASYSAWVHEDTHFEDDKNDGFLGMRVFADPEKCIQREVNAYNAEIALAKEAGRPDIVERLEELKRKEVAMYEPTEKAD